ncbi:MAG: putative ABC transport system ATP-binding protein [Puniceicoccaceae bacterium 5H]|nr:MAG: putative ABC transport system ATP-binding protein [Puniceicoccaceae bacterium 5H]
MSSDAPIVLETRDLCHRYEDRVVLDHVRLSVPQGERVAIMGPSGAGKSTLLNCLGGIEEPDSGHVLVGGQSLRELDEEARAGLRRQEIGSIFQLFFLLPTLSAFENVELPLLMLHLPKKERRERVQALLDEVGVAHRAGALPRQLSGGEMQRVAIARALAPHPKVLLADEPTGNLDSHSGERVLDLLARVSETHRTAMVMVTHAAEATRICHRTVWLRDGVLSDQPQPAHA